MLLPRPAQQPDDSANETSERRHQSSPSDADRTIGSSASSRAVAMRLPRDCSRRASAIVLISEARTARLTRLRRALTLRL